MSATRWVPGPLYGLRSWTVVSDGGGELLAGPLRGTRWPPAGDWLEARCDRFAVHSAPVRDCQCGIHAWHPRPASVRRVLASRREIAGVVEAAGVVEVHEEGIRAERARPCVLFVSPRCNPHAIARLAATYRADAVEVSGPPAVLTWCREHHLGLAESVVTDLIGATAVEEQRRTRRRKRRLDAIRGAAAVLAAATLALVGDWVLSVLGHT